VNGNYKDYGDLKHKYYRTYLAAKHEFNMKSAYEIIDRCVKEDTVTALARVISQQTQRPILVFPTPSFDEEDAVSEKPPLGPVPANAIPFAYAEYLSIRLDCPVNQSIIQVARPGRSRLTMWMRFLCQPSFEGAVEPGRPYILLDDVMTTGGTFAALRGYVVSRGASVVGTTTLAHKNGVHQKFAIAPQTLSVLRSRYGNGFDVYWIETFGHEASHLTEAESEFLAFHARTEWASVPPGTEVLYRLRERVNRAAATGG